jgi:hypothetical protein
MELGTELNNRVEAEQKMRDQQGNGMIKVGLIKELNKT